MKSLRIAALTVCLLCAWTAAAQAVTVYGPGYAVSVPPYGPPPASYAYGPGAYYYGPPAPVYGYRGYYRPYGPWRHGWHHGPGHGWTHGGPRHYR